MCVKNVPVLVWSDGEMREDVAWRVGDGSQDITGVLVKTRCHLGKLARRAHTALSRARLSGKITLKYLRDVSVSPRHNRNRAGGESEGRALLSRHF